MVSPISEEAAREALRMAGSPAANPVNYYAERREGGWLFGWRVQRGAPGMGTRAWIVADNEQVRMLGLAERAADGIAAALGNE